MTKNAMRGEGKRARARASEYDRDACRTSYKAARKGAVYSYKAARGESPPSTRIADRNVRPLASIQSSPSPFAAPVNVCVCVTECSRAGT